MPKMVRILVDADSIFFKIALGPHRGAKNIKQAYNRFRNTMEIKVRNETVDPFSDDEFSIHYAVKGTGNFRKDLYPEYKAHRVKQDDEVRERLNFLHTYSIECGAVPADGMEADDLVSIWAYEAREKEEDYVICGIDKDLKQIPGTHYNYNKDTWDFVDDATAIRNLMLQCLTGDSADNIPGLKGIGPKKAEGILRDVPTNNLWDTVRATWVDHGVPNPELSYRLLAMIKTWEEFEDVRASLSSETSVSECDDGKEQDVQDSSVQCVSERDT